MNSRISTALATAAFGLAALVPGIGHAGTIGYHGLCSGGSNGSSAIVAAGHTPVAVATVDAASLRSLDGLLYINCEDVVYPGNAAVDAAVVNGMVLIFHDKEIGSSGNHVPGAGGLVLTDIDYSNPDSITPFSVDIPAGSPIATGPGGTLTNTSLDGNRYYTHRGYAAVSSLPVGSTVLATKPDPAKIVTFAYPYGSGRVVYGTVPIDVFLGGSIGERDGDIATPGVKAFAANLIAWALPQPFTTCAAEGFTGSKLTLCRQICEIDQTPTRLTSLIRLYVGAYRSEPPCAD